MRHRLTLGALLAVGIAVALVLVFVISPYGSTAPDGLQKVAADHHLDTAATPHALGDGPLAGYSVSGVGSRGLGKGVAGAIGVVLTFAICMGAFALLRGRPASPGDAARPARDRVG